jgi:hypothetical protein
LYSLSRNPNAIHLLKQYPDVIDTSLCELAINPSIFEYDYEAIRLRMMPLAEELMANRFHPRNFEKWLGWGFDDMCLDL